MKGIMAIAASLMLPRDVLREVNEVEREQRRMAEMLPEECNIEWMKICGTIAQGSTTQKTAEVSWNCNRKTDGNVEPLCNDCAEAWRSGK